MFFGLSAEFIRVSYAACCHGSVLLLSDCNDILKEMGIDVDSMMACGGGGKSPCCGDRCWQIYMAAV